MPCSIQKPIAPIIPQSTHCWLLHYCPSLFPESHTHCSSLMIHLKANCRPLWLWPSTGFHWHWLAHSSGNCKWCTKITDPSWFEALRYHPCHKHCFGIIGDVCHVVSTANIAWSGCGNPWHGACPIQTNPQQRSENSTTPFACLIWMHDMKRVNKARAVGQGGCPLIAVITIFNIISTCAVLVVHQTKSRG